MALISVWEMYNRGPPGQTKIFYQYMNCTPSAELQNYFSCMLNFVMVRKYCMRNAIDPLYIWHSIAVTITVVIYHTTCIMSGNTRLQFKGEHIVSCANWVSDRSVCKDKWSLEFSNMLWMILSLSMMLPLNVKASFHSNPSVTYVDPNGGSLNKSCQLDYVVHKSSAVVAI